MKSEDKLFISTSCIAGKNNYEEAFNFILNANIYNIEISGNHFHSNNDELIKLINNYKKENTNFIFHNYFPVPKNEIVMNLLSKYNEILLFSLVGLGCLYVFSATTQPADE